MSSSGIPVDRGEARRRQLAIAVAAGVGWLAVDGTWLALKPGGEDARMVFADTAYLLPIAVASAAGFVAARTAPSGLRRFWFLVALANTAWLAGEVLWSVRELTVVWVPFPWWTDVAYIGFWILIGLAFRSRFKPQFGCRRRGTPARGGLAGGNACAGLTVLHSQTAAPRRGSRVDRRAGDADGRAAHARGLLVTTRLLPTRHGTLGTTLLGAGLACGALTEGLYARPALTEANRGRSPTRARGGDRSVFAAEGLATALGADR